jgi:methyltransferase-like protein
MYVAANLRPSSHPHGSRHAPPDETALDSAPPDIDAAPLDVRTPEPATFRAANGAQLTTPDPMMKAAMVELSAAWPRSIGFESLVASCLARVHSDAVLDSRRVAHETEILGNDLIKCYVSGLAGFSVSPSRFVTTVSDRPAVCRLARWQAKSAAPVVTNRAHATISLSDLERQVLLSAGGTQDIAALIEGLHEKVASGELVILQSGQRLASSPEAYKTLDRHLADCLEQIARKALLIG